jgi:hypothetical protein
MHNYKNAIVEFVGGHGALLCNRCKRIISTGIEHEDMRHWCTACEQELNKYTETSLDGIGEN